MIDFNPAWIYHLAEDVTKLEIAVDGQKATLYSCLKELMNARAAIDHFLHHREHTLFPDTCDDLTEALTAIDAIVPPEINGDRPLLFDEVVQLQIAINRTVDTFERECGHKYIVGLEKQRALEPNTLIEEIESAIATECWKRLSPVTKREIEECGKCLAFERYTASGFHVLRALEAEIRAYVCLLLRTRPAKRDLGYYIDTLKANCADAKLIAALDNIRNLDRNPLMHPEDWLDRDDAIGIFNIAQVAFERLISEMERKNLLPPLGA